MKLIKKLFIKNYRKTSDPDVHHRYGVVAGAIGIFFNLLIFATGIVIGIISNSITIIVQSIGNLTDAGSSIITLVGFKLSSKPADKEHPFGHARVEYICGLLISLVMLILGVLFSKSCFEKILEPEEISIGIYTYVILSVMIAVKLFLAILYRNFAKDINSDTLLATSVDSRNDMLSSIAILISMIVMQSCSINIDGYIGLAVSLLTVVSAIRMINDTIDPLISVKPNKKLVSKIKRELLGFDGVNDMHDLLIHTYGSGSTFVSVHIEVPETTTLLDCHELVDKIERHFWDKLHINLTIQVDPIDIEDPLTKTTHERILKTLRKLNKNIQIHGVRIIEQKNKIKVLFDILEDFSSQLTKKQILDQLHQEFAEEKTPYEFVFIIDKPFT
ncbi:MAG: cation transporter [Clostridia bacterium]|nr:cation transporter [Clostridia bacterium]